MVAALFNHWILAACEERNCLQVGSEELGKAQLSFDSCKKKRKLLCFYHHKRWHIVLYLVLFVEQYNWKKNYIEKNEKGSFSGWNQQTKRIWDYFMIETQEKVRFLVFSRCFFRFFHFWFFFIFISLLWSVAKPFCQCLWVCFVFQMCHKGGLLRYFAQKTQ